MKLPVIPLLLVPLLLVPLAGCIGEPSTVATPGDTVRYEARFLAESGPISEPMTGLQTQVPEEGTEGIEGHLTGLGAGKTTTIHGTVVARERVFGPFSAIGQIPTQQFSAFFGEPTPGQTFQPEQSYYEFRVEAVDDGMVTYRAIPEDGQRDPLPILGAELVTYVEGDNMTQEIVPLPGQPFQVQQPTPGGGTILDMPPGDYLAAGQNETHAYFWSFAEDLDDENAQDARIELTIRRIQRSAALPVLDDNYGARTSPQIGASPQTPPLGTSEPVEDHDDHDHTH